MDIFFDFLTVLAHSIPNSSWPQILVHSGVETFIHLDFKVFQVFVVHALALQIIMVFDALHFINSILHNSICVAEIEGIGATNSKIELIYSLFIASIRNLSYNFSDGKKPDSWVELFLQTKCEVKALFFWLINERLFCIIRPYYVRA